MSYRATNDNRKTVFVPNIAFCILMDLVGMATYSIPFLGEFGDIVWAPVSAFIFYKTFGGRLGLFGGALDFLEELLPLTDFIPSFTIAWYLRNNTAKKIGI